MNHSFWSQFKIECRALMSNPVVLLTVFGGVVFYSFLYPLPYAAQTPKEQAIAVVNLDGSATSYKLERMIDATPQVQIVARLSSIEAAKTAFLANQVTGFVVIPEHFYKDLLLGKSPTLAVAADASYFLVYGTVVEGLAHAGGTLSAQVKVNAMLLDGTPLEQAKDGYTATKLNMKPTFNASMGYVQYVVPAVFVLILQQTLVMAVGLQTATLNRTQLIAFQSPRPQQSQQSQRPLMQVLLARTALFVAIYYVMSAFYFGFSFERLGVNHVAQLRDVLSLLMPFLLASSAIGIWLGYLLPRRELVTLVMLVSSMPLIFLAGFIWPIEAIPAPLLWLADLSPSTWAIKGFLGLNQMGASWQQNAENWSALWGLSLVWGALAGGLALKKARPRAN